MGTTAPTLRATKRSVLLRDGVVFLTLCGVTVVLFVLTLLLFRSFEHHREDLGVRWAERGRAALSEGHPDAAVAALRTALTYKDDLPDQLLLAQALADAGHTEEAENYFLTLKEGRPGDGFINLQLARLNRKQGDTQQAVDLYRAAIFGDWRGDGALRRREVRLELAAYLAQHGNASAARDELLIAAGNAPESPATDLLFGDKLTTIGAKTDALRFYRRSLDAKPHQRDAMARAGRLELDLGHYEEAFRLLNGAATERGGDISPAEAQQWAALAAEAHRLPELSLSRELPASTRAEHILAAAEIAQKRLGSCPAAAPAPTASGHTAPTPAAPAATSTTATASPLQALHSRWTALAGQLKKRSLERDAALEDSFTQLINDTELQTQTLCGPAQGDDALLLRVASSAQSAP